MCCKFFNFSSGARGFGVIITIIFLLFKELRFDLKYESDLRVQQRDAFYLHAT